MCLAGRSDVDERPRDVGDGCTVLLVLSVDVSLVLSVGVMSV